MESRYDAGVINIETRVDTGQLTKSLTEAQNKALNTASTADNVFKKIFSGIGNLFKNIFSSVKNTNRLTGKSFSDLNSEIKSIDKRMKNYQKQISDSSNRLNVLNNKINSLSAAKQNLNTETLKNINYLKIEARQIQGQINNYRKLYSELEALRKKKSSERYEAFIRRSNSDISLSNLQSNPAAAKGAIILAVKKALTYWKEAFGSFKGYGEKEIKYLLVGMSNYAQGMSIFKSLGSSGLKQILNKAKQLAAMLNRPEPVTRTFSTPVVSDEEKRIKRLEEFYKNYAQSVNDEIRRGSMSKNEIAVDKVKSSLNKILGEYNLTYEAIEAREHESMLRRGEITENEFIRIDNLLSLTKERIDFIREQNNEVLNYFTNFAVSGISSIVNGISNGIVSAVINSQNAIKNFGIYFKKILDQILNKIVMLIAKMLIMRTLMSIFGGSSFIAKIFGFKTGGGISSDGKIYKASTGMYVNTGTHSTADDVPVLLSRGEAVLNARVTSLLGGEKAIRALNNIGASGFKEGGIISGENKNITNIHVEGSIIDSQNLISILDNQAKMSGSKSLFNVGGLV